MPLTPDDLADALPLSSVRTVLQVSERTMRRIVASGEIDVVRIGSGRGRIMVTRRALADYINRRNKRSA